MTIAAGRLRHRIDIQQKQTAQDPMTGEQTESWVTLWDKVPAAIETLSAREFIAAQAVQSEIKARIVIRYRAGLDATMRILHGSKIYNPAAFLPDMDSGLSYLTIPCSEGVNAG
jgi:SPP1 family predicted phage head-tail adaptor